MSTRDQQIVAAALAVFSRYGVSRTTMNDIAAEAGVARQTLYNAFPGKPDLLRAAVRVTMQQGLDAIRLAWAATEDLGERIDAFFRHGTVTWFDAVHASPELAELLDGLHDVASRELAEGKARWIEYVEGEFAASGVRPRDPDITLSDIADFLFTAAKGAKDASATRAELLSRLRVIRGAVIAMTERP